MCHVFLICHDYLKPPKLPEVSWMEEPFPSIEEYLAMDRWHWWFEYPDNPGVYVWSDRLFRLPLIHVYHGFGGHELSPPSTPATFETWPRHRPVVALNRIVRWTADEHNRLPSIYPWNKMTQSLAKIHSNRTYLKKHMGIGIVSIWMCRGM